MTITFTIPALVAIVGALVYAFTTNAKVSALGLVTYGSGLTAALIVFGRALVIR
jgi:hypothetical protein